MKLQRSPVVIALLGLLLFAVGATSCVNNKAEIEQTTKGFVTAYQNQQYSQALDFLSTRLRTSEGDQKLINRMQVARLFSGTSQLKDIGEPTITGDTAKVWVDVQGLLGATNSIQLSLVKENGKWKIDGF